MVRKQFTAKKLASVEATTKVARGINHILCFCVAIAFGLLIAATAMPQKARYDELQAKLRQTQAREEEALAKKETKEIELHALREDIAYLEVQARDRLNYYRPGERVLRFDQNR